MISVFLAIAISSHILATPAAEEIRALADKTGELTACTAIDFVVDRQALLSRIGALAGKLQSHGASDKQLELLSNEIAARIKAHTPILPPFDDAQEPMVSYEQADHYFSLTQSACDAASRDEKTRPYLSRTGYQTVEGEKTYLGLQTYRGDGGDVGAMEWLADLYDAEVVDDPGHQYAISWLMKAVKLHSAHAAAMLSSYYLTGRGVKKDRIEAVKWSIVSETYGGDDETRMTRETRFSHRERSQGEARAKTWLNQ